MNTELILALNLGILLLAGIVVAIGTYRHEMRYRERLKRLAENLKNKLEEALERNRELEQKLAEYKGVVTPAASTSGEADVERNHAMNSLKQQLDMRDKRIAMLEEYKQRHSDETVDEQALLDDIIDGLRQELDANRASMEMLEKEALDNSILRSRVSQLTQEEDRQRSAANNLREKLTDASKRISDMMHLSKKAEGLQRDNIQLDKRVDELATKTVHLEAERDSLSAMYNEVANKESFQRKRIAQLEQQLEQARGLSGDSPIAEDAEIPKTDSDLRAEIEALEAELEDVRGELGRTLKEKAMVESHMLAMDKAVSTLDQRDAEFERLKKEHETLEMHFLMDQDDSLSGVDVGGGDRASAAFAEGEVDIDSLSETRKEDNVEFIGQKPGLKETAVKPQDSDPRKIKNNEAYASPLFLSVSEFWAKFIDEKDEVVILSTHVPNKPSRLCQWTYVSIGNDDLVIALGVDQDLSQRVASVLFDKPLQQLDADDIVDSVGEMTNIVAGFVANNLGDKRELSAPNHISRDELDQLLFYMQTTAEILVGTKHGRLYLGTIKNNI